MVLEEITVSLMLSWLVIQRDLVSLSVTILRQHLFSKIYFVVYFCV